MVPSPRIDSRILMAPIQPPPQPPERPRNGAGRPAGPSWWTWVVPLLLFAVFFVLVRAPVQDGEPEKTFASFLREVTAGRVDGVELHQGSGRIDVTRADGTTYEVQGPPGGLAEVDLALLDDEEVDRAYAGEPSEWLPTLLVYLLPVALIVGLLVWMSRRAQSQLTGMTTFGRSKARVHSAERPSTTFADVAGYDGVKTEISEVVEFLRQPEKFRSIGARIPKGLLLVGPPGTGKTLFARAIAGEAGVPFISITGSEFLEMFVGVGAARVRDLFETARKHAPCIVFVDEIDAIGRKRGTGLGGGHDEREQTLNQLLAEMDGFEVTEGIVMLAATNRPDILDPALLRAGRFDRQVVIPLPTQAEREEILAVHCHGKRLADDVDLELVARGTPGMSGADLANLVNVAALMAVRRQADTIAAGDLDAARDRILMGMQRTSLVLGEDEKRVIAHHEAGHAVLAQLLLHADPVHKVTILPTGIALGATQQLPVRERFLNQRPDLDDALAVRLGGRAAEDLVFGTPSTGAHDDLITATELARKMVREWGMSERLGHLAWGSQGAVFLGEDLIHTRDYSDDTARVIDEETERILAEQADRARHTLEQHRVALDAVATALLEHETLTGEAVATLVSAAEHTPVSVPHTPPEQSSGSTREPVVGR
jgi:cell division protease FtsH